jgi:hypothetical protein
MLAAVDRVVFSTECVRIGAFRCAASHPSFRNSGPIRDDCFVFPRTTVLIQHDHARAFVADPTLVTLYNRRQVYERRFVCPDGDRCDWFAVSQDLLRAALIDHDPSAAEAERPIRFTHTRADAVTYLEQRRLFIDASDPADPDPLDVEERVVASLDRVLNRPASGRDASAVRQEIMDAGTIMPPIAAAIGRAAWRGDASSPAITMSQRADR